jgi:hypothetical protein
MVSSDARRSDRRAPISMTSARGSPVASTTRSAWPFGVASLTTVAEGMRVFAPRDALLEDRGA